VAAMKVTASAAMRARDVSRPHAEHLARAEAVEASAAGSRPGDGPAGADGPVPADGRVPGDGRVRGDAAGADAVPGDEVRRRGGRRWRPRGSGRGRASR
jgi:hypothetical protein